MSRKAHYIQWGRGKWHVARVPEGGTLADGQTACGKDVPEQVRLTTYPPLLCTRCVKADPEGVELAEQERLRQVARQQERHVDERERARRGEFVVWRCRKCGQQARPPHRGRGLIVCMAPAEAPHDQEPVEVIAIGPPWEAPQ